MKAKIGLAYISDRGDMYLPKCKASRERFVKYPFACETVIDDRDHRLGLAGAARAAWNWALENDCEYLFHVEEDFRFVRDVDLEMMVDILTNNLELAELTLHRQCWSSEEAAAGGVMQRLGSIPKTCAACGHRWSTQRFIFSLNPSLIPKDVLSIGWPDDNEAGMTEKLLYRGYEFGFLGHPGDDPYTEHIGHVRGSGWKL